MRLEQERSGTVLEVLNGIAEAAWVNGVLDLSCSTSSSPRPILVDKVQSYLSYGCYTRRV
jgi:hypothetical protein